jgi:hypothetical protein
VNNTINCPTCGHQLIVDVLTNETMPCPECGTVATTNDSGRLIPDPTHQTNINRQKFFEIATVIVLIFVGFGYFAISSGGAARGAGSTALHDLAAILESENFTHLQDSNALGQTFHSYTTELNTLQIQTDLVALQASEETQAIIITVFLPNGDSLPPADKFDAIIQDTFNDISELTELLIPSSTDSLSKALKTTVPVTSNETKFHKGVAQTSSGWKITYQIYRTYNTEQAVPMLLFIFQHLDAASDPQNEAFSQVLFNAANSGQNILQAMQNHEKENSAEN